MKKRIVALIGALTLTFAMSLNVFAAGSVTADDINSANEAAGETIKVEQTEDGRVVAKIDGVEGDVAVSTDSAALSSTASQLSGAQLTAEDNVTAVEVSAVSSKDALTAAVAAAQVLAKPSVAGVAKVTAVSKMTNPVEINPPADKKGQEITMAFSLFWLGFEAPADENEQIWAIDCDTNKVVVGVVTNGKVYFTSNEFSKYVFTKVKVEKQAASTSQPAYNPDWDPAVQQQRKAAAQAEHEAAWAAYLAAGGATIPVVALAPKTGDVVAMVSIMAVIFLGGAATAVVMSKKRA